MEYLLKKKKIKKAYYVIFPIYYLLVSRNFLINLYYSCIV